MNESVWRHHNRFFHGYHRILLMSAIIAITQALIILPVAFVVRYIFDEIIPAGDLLLLTLMCIAILVLHLTSSGMTLWMRHMSLKVIKGATLRFREELLKRCYTFSRHYYTQADLGKLHASIIQDTSRVDVMSHALAMRVVPALITGVVLCAVLLYLNWFLFLAMACISPLVFFASHLMSKKVSEWTKTCHRCFETVSQGVLFVLQRMDLTRAQAAERFETERQVQHLEALRGAEEVRWWLGTAHSEVHKTILAIAGVIVLMVGGAAISKGSMTIGELASFAVVANYLRSHLSAVAQAIPEIIDGKEALVTLISILHVEDRRPYTGCRRIEFSGRITLESVDFQYDDHPVLRDTNLAIHPGTTVAIVGPNGAGKSTIAHLILGFYQPQQGQLYADDCPFDELDLAHLRECIGIVMQEPIIFPGTIRENVTYGCPHASLHRVIQASELATAHGFVEELPQGYDTPIGENGALLSGGQRQQVALARALLRQPKLLILDEPTNHLDAAAVRRLMDNLMGLDNAPAVLLISHDMAVTRQAQHIYALAAGRIEPHDQYPPLAERAESKPMPVATGESI